MKDTTKQIRQLEELRDSLKEAQIGLENEIDKLKGKSEPCTEGKWGYTIHHSETGTGNEESRDAVVAAAQREVNNNYGSGTTVPVDIGVWRKPDPAAIAEDLAKGWVDDFVELMDEWAMDAGWWSPNEPVFDLHSGAGDALANVLGEWAANYAYTNWFTLSDIEHIKLIAKGESNE